MGQKAFSKNTLFYGDNLAVMREYIADESVDLIYLDPPFNSNRNYNILYKDESGNESDAQITAFKDTWHWNIKSTEPEFRELAAIGDGLGRLMETLVDVMGRNQMTAYLVMMANRLKELHRVLKPTGSIYLHCDPTASHYLKLIMDMIFGARNFKNEIVWKRTSAHNNANKYGRIHDILLYYAKNNNAKPTFNTVYVNYDTEYISSEFREDEQGKLYKTEDLTAPYAGGNKRDFDFHGRMPGTTRQWRLSKDKMEILWEQGRIKIGKDEKPLLRGHIIYLEEKKGMPLQDLWSDVLRVGNTAKERLGYPTQKPVALLERIIMASSNEGDVIMDPFCGCGTAVHAAQKLKRTWLGIDITHLATALIKQRLFDAFKIKGGNQYDIIGEPINMQGAEHLAKQDRFQFQWWALGLLPARPFGAAAGNKKGKKGKDKGIDGIMTFNDTAKGKDKRIIVQVKSGKVSSRDIRDLHGTVEREKQAVMGVFITLLPATRDMLIESMEVGYYHSKALRQDYPKIQIYTIEELLEWQESMKDRHVNIYQRTIVKMPFGQTTLKQAEREADSCSVQHGLGV